MPDSDITALFDEWNSALQTGEPKNVSALYETNAILLPTVSNKVRHNHEEIEDYFVHFLAKGPKGEINESNVRTFGDIAINSGTEEQYQQRAKMQAGKIKAYKNKIQILEKSLAQIVADFEKARKQFDDLPF